MSKCNYGILHNHSTFSIRDSAMTLQQLFERAKELEAPAVALTDHGILVGIIDFMKLGKEYGIKPIPGIETYYVHDAENDPARKGTKSHLILMAKDLTGYQAISAAVYRSYLGENLLSSAGVEYPRMTDSVLRECFGPGSEGYGHVIATSACAGGVLAKILLEDETLKDDTKKLEAKRDKYHPIDQEVLDAIKSEEDMLDEIGRLTKQRDMYAEAAKRSAITGMKRRLRTLTPVSKEYTALQAELDGATKAQEDAKEKLAETKCLLAAKRREKTVFSNSIKPMKESAAKWAEIDEQITAILSGSQGDEVLYQKAKAEAQNFVEIFGEGNFYIELQYHHIENEKKTMPVLAQLAKELNIPVVAANDAHYASNSYEDIRARTLIAAMRFNTPVDDEMSVEGYGELYMKTDNELRAALCEILDPDTVDTAIRNIGVIVEQCNVEFPHESHYPVFKGGNPGESAAQRLRRLAEEGIPNRYPDDQWTPDKQERMEYELGVIEKMGYSDYLCIVQDFLAYGRSLADKNPEHVGYTIGPGRGSAVGSIVCYLSGITSVDPMKYGLLFERFLNPERVSMPDIDSDFSKGIRDKVVEYVRDKYGEKAVCNITTKNTLAGRSAIRGVGRVTNIPASIVDSVARMVPNEVHAKIDDIPNLEQVCDENPVIKQLITDAKLVEGTVVTYGVHAAGVIISDNDDVGKYVPMCWNSKLQVWVAQCDMVQCESDCGLLKMDFLGLENLDIITDTLRRIKRNYGLDIDIERLPIEPEVFANIFSAANTDCVFQFASNGMKDMLRQFRPSSMEDLILLVAAYRPGPMQYIPEIIKVKQGQKTPAYIADGLEDIMSLTYGSPIYQEQVMSIFNKIAGFSLGESDIIRRAMSKKKLAVLTDPQTDYHGKFVHGLIANHAAKENAEAYWEQLLDFASYAFNKSHAAAYAHVSYYTAWLKYHYPAEYMSSVMSASDFKKLPQYINNCRKMGLTIEKPDINRSMDGFSNVERTILYGFGNVKGVGNSGRAIEAERHDHGQFVSVQDFITRMLQYQSDSYKKTTIENLVKTGAFDAFCAGNRTSILDGIEPYSAAVRKVLSKTRAYEEAVSNYDALAENTSEAETKKAERKVSSTKKSLDTARQLLAEQTFLYVEEDNSKKLEAEYELLGFYISGNPFDNYTESASAVKGRQDIADALDLNSGSKVTICGIAKELKMFQRKSDGRPFCSFDFYDSSSEIEVKCFTGAYERFGSLIHDGSALTISGRVHTDENVMDDGTIAEFGRYVTVDNVGVLARNSDEFILATGALISDWVDSYQEIKRFADPTGYKLVFCASMEQTFREAEFRVKKSILDHPFKNLLVSVAKKSELP